MKTYTYRFLLGLCLCVVQIAGQAEDIDLFGVQTGTSSGNAPNILFVIDNGAGFSASASESCLLGTPAVGTAATGTATASNLSGKAGGIEQCALFNVIQAMTVTSVAKVRIGVMVYKGGNVVNFNGVGCTGSTDGGCLVYPIVDFTSSNKVALLTWIKNWSISNGDTNGKWIKAANADGGVGASMQEAWAYYAGKTGLSGTDYSGVQPVSGCSKNFVLYIGSAWGTNTNPHDLNTVQSALDGTHATAAMRANPAATTAQKVQILPTAANRATVCGNASVASNSVPSGSGHEGAGMYGDEWARYMASQNITTYTIGITEANCSGNGQKAYSWVLKSMATYGGGKYFSTSDTQSFQAAVSTVLSEVQSVNSVFAAVSLPVSVNTQGTYLNQVFIGMFRPDGDSLPNWLGNLKQYKMGFSNAVFRLLDASGAAAISSSGSGFIAECARSYWTPTVNDDYWSTLAIPNCLTAPAASNTPDGNLVEKGGQGYLLRANNPSNRLVTTCPAGGCTALTNFTTAVMGAGTVNSDATLQSTLINWSRGQNSKGEIARLNGADIATTDMRPSVHGDVVHSRPVAINFGNDALPKVVVFYGANDGMLRAINGNRSALIGSVAAGGELWSFMPSEFYGKINRRYDNTAKILTPTVPGTPKDYGMDGPVTGYIDASNSAPAFIYAGMRRGGRGLYAFAIDRTTLAVSPKWKIGCDSSSCTTGFSDIGQTWATPTIVKSSGYGSGASPMLVMGGGYDATCEDAFSYACTSTTGKHIYVIDADTGDLLKTFDTYRGVTGDVMMLKDANGMATYGYATDLGGDVYRISGSTANTPIGSTPPANWTITKFAMLGCGTLLTRCTAPPNRKFMYGPDVVVEGTTNYLLVGSGDRERPLNTANTTQNFFFMLKDEPTNTTWLSDESARCDGNNVLCLASLAAPVTQGSCASTVAPGKGWSLQLAANEQVVTSAITIYGISYFSTHEPVATLPNVCTPNLGKARSYAVPYATAGSAYGCGDYSYSVIKGGGLPPSPVGGKVVLDDGTIVPFVIGGGGGNSSLTGGSTGVSVSSGLPPPDLLSPLEASKLNPPAGSTAPTAAKIKSYWYIKK